MPTIVGSASTSISVDSNNIASGNWTSTTGTNSGLIVFLPYYNGSGSSNVTSVTWGALNLTRISGTPPAASIHDYIGEIWFGALGATHTGETRLLTVNWDLDVSTVVIVQQMDSCHQTAANHHDGGNVPSTDSANPSVSIGNCATTDFIAGCFVKADGTNDFTHSNTLIANLVNPAIPSHRLIAFYKTNLSGPQSISATIPATFWGGAGVAIAHAAGGGTPAYTYSTRRKVVWFTR